MYGGNIPLERRYDKCQDDWLGKQRDMIRIK